LNFDISVFPVSMNVMSLLSSFYSKLNFLIYIIIIIIIIIIITTIIIILILLVFYGCKIGLIT
jgi:hypothetical protein